jgi:predicted acylesterase/phospholipase RssA
VKAYAFHVGVLQGLERDGFFFRSGPRWQPRAAPVGAREIDLYVGSSAGACVVASVAGGHPVDHLREAVRGRSKDVPTFGYRVLFVPVAPNPARYLGRLARRLRMGRLRPHHLVEIGGLLTTSGVERYFRRHVLPTNRFADLAVDLFIAATQVNNARKVIFGPVDSLREAGYDASRAYYDNVPISQAVAAAVAVPPLFAPYAIASPTSGKLFHYYDGEVRETLSLDVARDAGADFVIASSVWHPYTYDDRVGTLADLGISALAEQAIHQAIEQKVDRDRKQAQVYERLLELIARHASQHGMREEATQTLVRQVCELIGHRPMPTLYVTPPPEDNDFFFEGAFRFDRRMIDRCVEAGERAYWAAVRDNPAFLAQLDRQLGCSRRTPGDEAAQRQRSARQ